MNDAVRLEPMMQVPTAAESERAIQQARSLFHRILSVWACDLLALRKAGLDTPGWTATPPDAWWREAA
jgi:hypothetical protein